jgi:hypothetical protein
MQMRWGRYGVKSGRLVVRASCSLIGRRIGARVRHIGARSGMIRFSL